MRRDEVKDLVKKLNVKMVFLVETKIRRENKKYNFLLKFLGED